MVITTLALAGILPAQRHRPSVPGVPAPVYSLSVTSLDWKIESMTGLSTRQIEQQVGDRLMEGLGWSRKLRKHQAHEPRLPEGKIRVKLDIVARNRQQVAYTFRVMVDTPAGWPRNLDVAAWHWEQERSGASKLGDYPRAFRKDMDQVLKNCVAAWKARFE